MMTAADLQNLAARVQSYEVGANTRYVTLPWPEWEAVLAQAHTALTLADNNARLRQSLTLHEGPHVTMTVECAREMKDAALCIAHRLDGL